MLFFSMGRRCCAPQGIYDVADPARTAFYEHADLAKNQVNTLEKRKKAKEKAEAEEAEKLAKEAAEAEQQGENGEEAVPGASGGA